VSKVLVVPSFKEPLLCLEPMQATRYSKRIALKNNTSFLLLRQDKGYANIDPGDKQKQAITGSVLR
jgi:hypothetical protein